MCVYVKLACGFRGLALSWGLRGASARGMGRARQERRRAREREARKEMKTEKTKSKQATYFDASRIRA